MMSSYRYTSKGNNRRELRLSIPRKKNRGENLAAWRKRQKQLTESENAVLANTSNQQISPDNQCSITPVTNVNDEKKFVLAGRRIVDISYFLNELKTLNKHGPFECGLSEMEVISEVRHGLISDIKMSCQMCGYSKIVSTENKKSGKINCNTASVAGIIKIGCGFSNMEEFYSTLDIPCMATNTFIKEQNYISDAWETAAMKEMELAGEEEKKMAVERGDVDAEGVPLITVVVDGAWAKRSYRTNYASLSGVAVIIGFETKKVLFIGVRNKYCCICARASTKNVPPKPHQCYKNWSGSSSGMEADIIVEGFCSSVPMHGVKYARVIGDGDSNVHKSLLDANPYQNLRVEKIECKNHLLRNACSKLQIICKDSKNKNVLLRKIIGSRIQRIRTAVSMAVRYRKKDNSKTQQERIVQLRKDILNAPLHVFGHHEKCASYFCDKKNETDYICQMKECGLFYKVMNVMNILADNSRSLLHDVNTNTVEKFNNVIAKFVGGKRVNFCQRRSYQTRCNAAVVANNTKTPLQTFHKQLYGCSPGSFSKLSENRKVIRTKRNLSYKNKTFKRKRLFVDDIRDNSYGYNAQKPDLDTDTYEIKKTSFLKGLSLNDEERSSLFLETKLQSESQIWMAERKKRLTASNFGYICNKLPHTKCDTIVKKILYNNVETESMRYGRRHESDAIIAIKNMNIDIKRCGLIVDKQLPFLAATPDGFIGEDGIVEVKCPASCSELTPEEAILSRKVTFWKLNRKTKEIMEVNKKHVFYFQIQGQLHISERNYCLFALWTPKGVKTVQIIRDDLFWQSHMEDKLTKFYYDCLLPEIVDPRYPRKLPIRNPAYILEAEKQMGQKREIDSNIAVNIT